MKKLSKIFLSLVILTLVASALVVGVGAEDTVTTFSQLYIGDYASGNFSGQAHIVFGTVSNETAEYGVIITDSEGNSYKFPGKAIGTEGKFGIAIYELPDGDYVANAYTGADGSRILGESVPFTKGVSSYTVTYDFAGGTADYVQSTVAQGSTLALPDAPQKEGFEFLGWMDDTDNQTLFDTNEIITKNMVLTAAYKPIEDRVYRIVLDSVTGGQNTYMTSAITPTLDEGEQVIMEFDILNIYSAPATRYVIGAVDITHSKLSNWTAYNGTDTEYAQASYLIKRNGQFYINAGMGGYPSGEIVYGNEGWYLTGGSEISGDASRWSAGITWTAPYGGYYDGNAVTADQVYTAGESIKIVYTPYTSETEKGSLSVYTKATSDADSAYVLSSSIQDLPANRADLERTVMLALDSAGDKLDMLVTNLSVKTSDGEDLGVMVNTTYPSTNTAILDANPQFSFDHVYSDPATTATIGGKNVLPIEQGGQLVYEFDIVSSNYDEAQWGYVGLGLLTNDNTTNWPGNLIYMNSAGWDFATTGFGGTFTYYKEASYMCWYNLLRDGASVKVVYTRATSGNSDGAFSVYRKLDGESDYSLFMDITGIADITSSGRIVFMFSDPSSNRELVVENLRSYTLSASGVKTGTTFGGWNSIESKATISDATGDESTVPSYSVEYYFEDLNGDYVLDESKTEANIEGVIGSTVWADIKTFDHFTYDGENSTISGTVVGDNSLVLKVYYTRNTYTVTFDGSGGTLVSGEEVQTVKYEGAAVAPVYTTDIGTLGWDKDFSYIISDITVNAVWSGAVTITFDANGGETELSTKKIAQNTVLNKPSDVPVKANWEFIGWADADGKLFDFSTEISENITLTAEYAPLTGDVYRLHLTNSEDDYAYMTSAVNPVLEAGETVTMEFDIVNVYSQPARFIFATSKFENMGALDWTEKDGYASFYSRSTGIFAPYSGMGTYVNTNDTASDEGWILTGGSAISGDVARWCSPVSWAAPIGYYGGTTADQIMTNGDNIKVVYTPYQSETAKGSILIYKNGALMCGIKDLSATRATLDTALMIAIDNAGDNLDMLVTNVSVTTSNGVDLGFALGTSDITDVATFVHNSDINYKMDHVGSEPSYTGGIGGKDLLTLTAGQKLVYEFDIVDTLFGEITGVEGHNVGYVGFGYTSSTNVSNWPGVMMAGPASGSVSGTWAAGTLNRGPLANNYGWYKLFENGATVRIEYVYGTNNDTSYTIYKVVDGVSEMFAEMVNIPNASAPASVRIQSMFSDPNEARKLIVTNLRSYSESADGVKLAETYAGWNSVECLTTIDSITMSEQSAVRINAEYTNVSQYCKLQLTAEVVTNYLEDRTVTWSSNNEAIAIVDAETGVVKGLSVGVATITATSADGSIATCEITVDKANGVTFMWQGQKLDTVGVTNEDNTISANDVPVAGLSNDVASDIYVENWYTSETFETVWAIDTEVVADITVYGKPAVAFTYTVDGGNATITGMVDDEKITSIENLCLPSTIEGYTVTEIADSAFEGATHAYVFIPATVEVIHDEAFKDCVNLDTVEFEEGSALVTVGDSAFRGCSALTNITLPEGVTSVGELAFYGANTSYGNLYNLNMRVKGYYAPKFTYEFMGEDTLPIGGYIEPSIGYFAEGVTLEQVIKDTVDSGTNILINVGQARNGMTAEHYELMYQYFEKYGGMMIDANGWANNPQGNYASYAGKHAEDEAGVVRWLDDLYYYNQYNNFAQTQGGGLATVQKNWRKENNRKLYFTNLLPINSPVRAYVFGAVYYTSNSNETTYDSDGNLTSIAHPLYDEYMETYANYTTYYTTYIENVNPDVFVYDFYPMWINGKPNGTLQYPDLNSQHFEQLYTSYYYAYEYNKQVYGYSIPFWNFLQLSNIGGRSSTYNELVWQINTAFVFGSKGYQYYCYNDYNENSSYSGTTAINIDGTKNTTYYNMVQSANTQSQAYAKWLLNANVDHIAQYGSNPNSETINSAMFTSRDASMSWRLSSTSGKNHLVSYMKYYANNNQYEEGVEGDVRELYFVCNNATQSSNAGTITLNFGSTVSGSYIYNGVEYTFSGTSLSVSTNAGEGFAVLLNK